MHKGNKTSRRLFLHRPGRQVRHKMLKKKNEIKKYLVKQPTQSVPQSKVLSIKIALNAYGTLHVGIALSASLYCFLGFFWCFLLFFGRHLRHGVMGELVKVSLRNLRSTNCLHSEMPHHVIAIFRLAIFM